MSAHHTPGPWMVQPRYPLGASWMVSRTNGGVTEYLKANGQIAGAKVWLRSEQAARAAIAKAAIALATGAQP